MTEPQRTPLEDEHRSLGAKLVEFAGWLMPLEYAGTLKEHRAVREAVGMFDLTHLGKVKVRGPGALEWLQRAVTNDLSRLHSGQAQYNLVLNDDGGIVDDLIAYREEDESFLVVPNAANTVKVLDLLGTGAPRDVDVTHLPGLVTIAVQGPVALELVDVVLGVGSDLYYMHAGGVAHGDQVVYVGRSGYTGEPGVELYVPAGGAVALWREILGTGRPLGLEPCGLGARDTLRLEMGYPLHGSDISEDRTPLEAGLSWAVAFDKGEFRGRRALLKQKEEGIPARLRGLRMEGKLIPRAHYAVYADGRTAGEITSGTFSPTLRVGIALAYLDPGIEPGDRVEVDIRGRRGEAEVVKPPFVDRSPK